MAGAKLLIVACATTTGHNLKKFKKTINFFSFSQNFNLPFCDFIISIFVVVKGAYSK